MNEPIEHINCHLISVHPDTESSNVVIILCRYPNVELLRKEFEPLW